MEKNMRFFCSTCSLIVFILFPFSFLFASEIDNTIDDIPEILLGSELSKEHQDISEAKNCMECHRVKTDTVTSATQRYLSDEKGRLNNNELWDKITEFFISKQSCVLATSINNQPYVTTIDLAIDKSNKYYYGFCEKGTNKLNQIKANTNVAVEFHNQTEWQAKVFRCLQMIGEAKVFSSESPEYNKGLEVFKPSIDIDTIKRGMDMIRFKPNEILFYDSHRRGSNINVFQLWER